MMSSISSVHYLLRTAQNTTIQRNIVQVPKNTELHLSWELSSAQKACTDKVFFTRDCYVGKVIIR